MRVVLGPETCFLRESEVLPEEREHVAGELAAAEREEALAFLKSPRLMELLREDFAAVGCVGEETAMLIGYLGALSRKLSEPLAALFCARSGAGKSNLQERITDFVPSEDLIKYTRITGQALFYKDENALAYKVLAIDEEEGASEAAYALRNLQSGGYLSVSSTRTDPQTGKQRAEDYRVNGPCAIFLTTAHPEALDDPVFQGANRHHRLVRLAQPAEDLHRQREVRRGGHS